MNWNKCHVDNLPEMDKEVMLFGKEGIDRGTLFSNEIEEVIWVDKNLYMIPNVTHWAELPEYPKD